MIQSFIQIVLLLVFNWFQDWFSSVPGVFLKRVVYFTNSILATDLHSITLGPSLCDIIFFKVTNDHWVQRPFPSLHVVCSFLASVDPGSLLVFPVVVSVSVILSVSYCQNFSSSTLAFSSVNCHLYADIFQIAIYILIFFLKFKFHISNCLLHIHICRYRGKDLQITYPYFSPTLPMIKSPPVFINYTVKGTTIHAPSTSSISS